VAVRWTTQHYLSRDTSDNHTSFDNISWASSKNRIAGPRGGPCTSWGDAAELSPGRLDSTQKAAAGEQGSSAAAS